MICRECGKVGPATREEARRARWEPWSVRNRDRGPMVCPECIGAILGACMDALRAHSRAGGK